MNFPRISIVTPSYNQGKYIEQTIQSVLNQNYPNLEYIIIDGGSSDNTVEIIKKYEGQLTYWISEPDAGQTDAINKGYYKCTGDIFNWINSDDYYEQGVFNKLAQVFSNDAYVQVVCGKEWGFNDADHNERIFFPGSVIGKSVFETIQTGVIDQPCTFFRKKNIDNFFPLNTSLRYVMDKQLWWSYLLANGQQHIYILDDIFTHFRLHINSKSIAEAHLFQHEFDVLKYSLFQQLNAPAILKEQLSTRFLPVNLSWLINIKPEKFILAAFASHYAQRSYIKEEMNNAANLIRLVKKYKGLSMNWKEWKLWIICCLMPWRLLKILKQIKQKS